VKERHEFGQRGCRDLGLAHQLEPGASLAGRHPLGQQRPGAIGEQTREAATPAGEAMLPLDGQRLADERVPGIVNGGEARKLRSM